MNAIQRHLNRFPIAGISLSVVTAIASYISSGSTTRAGMWISDFFQLFSVAFFALVIVGVFMGELLKSTVGYIARGDTDAQYYLESEIKALQRELAKLSAQYETVSNELERLESAIDGLEDSLTQI